MKPIPNGKFNKTKQNKNTLKKKSHEKMSTLLNIREKEI